MDIWLLKYRIKRTEYSVVGHVSQGVLSISFQCSALQFMPPGWREQGKRWSELLSSPSSFSIKEIQKNADSNQEINLRDEQQLKN